MMQGPPKENTTWMKERGTSDWLKVEILFCVGRSEPLKHSDPHARNLYYA